MNFTALQQMQEHLRAAPDAQEIGHLLWWQLNGTRIDHPQLVAAAERCSLDSKYLPAAIKPVQAFRRAWRHAVSKLRKGLMLRPIAETSDEIVIGLVKERPDEERRDLDYNLVGRISFDKEQTTIAADAEHEVVGQIRELFEHHRAHTTEDIRSMMSTFLSEAGVSLRDSGGVYFVLAAHGAQLEALCRVVEEVGHNRTFRLLVVDTPATRGTLREVAERTLDDEVRELEEELASLDFERVRDSTLERRMEMFDQLRNRASLFAGVLNLKADAIYQRIGTMKDQLRRHLSIDYVPTEAPSVAPNTTPPTSTTLPAFAEDVGF